ncbi:MAG: putative phosphoesterase [uncultured Thermomicrobiales bacterium]|uniref:Phosphoesterase n=1 Tax=uncultured Thermomicrobiales bacterium TaxID=1645740 RepID=A0A6J4U8X0_9BACT|nr:MAG: putative phosphoesterase [uncultured Thermomicrobiales bacterium]
MRESDIVTSQRTFGAPLTIGVIADTHIYPHSRRIIPIQVIRLFQRAKIDLLIHLGDVNTRFVLEELGEIAPLIAVPGNNDDDELQDMLPASVRFTVGRFRFGAIHGHGGRSAKQVVTDTFAGKVDCALFGHSHIPYMDQKRETVLFNPGSATDRRWHEHFGVGIISVEDIGIDPELILYTDPAHLENITFE